MNTNDMNTKVPCKTCEGRGLMLNTKRITNIGGGVILNSEEIVFAPVACSCCGGWADDCENCRVGYQKITWADEYSYPTVFESWLEEDVLYLMKLGYGIDHMTIMIGDKEEMEIEQMFNFLHNYSKQHREDIKTDLKELIPGNAKKDVVVLARRARLAMMQILYDKGKLTVDEARAQLNGNLSPDKPETYYDDSDLLQLKEMDNGSKNESEDE